MSLSKKVILFFLVFVFAAPQAAYAQVITPTLYCLGSGSCAIETVSPTLDISPTGKIPLVTSTPSNNPNISISPTSRIASSSPSQALSPSPAPCSTLESSVKEQSTSDVQAMHQGKGKQHAPQQRGFLQLFIEFLLQLLLLLFQQLGIHIPSTNPCPTSIPSSSPTSAVPSSVPSSSNPTSGASTTAPTTSSGQPTTIPLTSAPVTGTNCTNPTQTLPMDAGNAQAGVTIGNFYLTNDNWNTTTGSQTMYICSPSSWYVTANQGGSSGTAVLSYPNAHEDFNNHPAISSFSSITSDFGNKGPSGGDYEYAYDMWINGEASSGSTEIMIWTDNHGQTPAGSQVGTVTLGGVNYTIWKGGSTISYVMNPATVTSGTVDILAVYKDIISRGWLTSSAQVYQIDYGVEICNTAGGSENFDITNFTLTTN